MDEINPDEVANIYNNLNEIWPITDKWHLYTQKQINEFIQSVINQQKLNSAYVILNAGSGGSNYGIDEKYLIHLDIAESKIKNKPKYLIGNISKIPLKDSSVDMIICVGSVLNYSNPTLSIREFNRILKPNGTIILEYETTDTLEYLFTEDYGKAVALKPTFYNGGKIVLNMFSQKFIRNILYLNKLHIETVFRFHIISPFFYRSLKNGNIASRFTWLDTFARLIPYLSKTCSNCILLGKKIA